MSDPIRLSDAASGASPALRGLLASAQSDGPTAADLAKIAARLGPILVATVPATAAAAAVAAASQGAAGAGAAGAAGAAGTAGMTGLAGAASGAAGAGATAVGTATAVAGGAGLVKLVVLASVGGAILVAGSFKAGQSYEAERREQAEKVAVVAPAPRPEVPKEAAPVEETLAEVAAPEPAKEASALEAAPPAPVVKPNARPVKAAPKSAPAPEPQTEVALLEQAMAAMGRGDAAAALALTERHGRAFPQGGLGQEREMLAIEALLKLGRSGDARLRAQAFRARYPTSSHLIRLDAMVGR